MFGTWRIDSSGSSARNPTFLRESLADQKACDRCRAKKLKCTGEVSGCERCTNLGVQCTYLAGSAPPSRRRRRLSGKSTSVATKRQKLSPPCPSPEVLDSNCYKDNSLKGKLLDTKQEPPDMTLPWSDFNDTQLYDEAGTFGALLGKSDDDILSLFTDLDSMSTETSLELLTPLSVPSPAITDLRRTVENENEEICQCLHHVVLVLNKLEVMLDNYHDPAPCKGGVQLTQSTGGLDSALQLHKKAVQRGDSMRRCGRCFSRAENKILLSLLVKRLVALCTYMVSVSSTESSQLCGNLFSIPTAQVMAGEYQVDTSQEAGAVFRELVAFQLSHLHKFLNSLHVAGHDKPQGVEFQTARNRVCGLLWHLRQDSLMSVFESTALSHVL